MEPEKEPVEENPYKNFKGAPKCNFPFHYRPLKTNGVFDHPESERKKLEEKWDRQHKEWHDEYLVNYYNKIYRKS